MRPFSGPIWARLVGGDRGSAPLEFLAFGVPTLVVTLIVCQLLVAGYLNNLILDAAMEGALVASAADGNVLVSQDRAKHVLAAASPGLSIEVEVTDDQLDGVAAKAVTVRSRSPLVMFGAIPLTQTARAFDENP